MVKGVPLRVVDGNVYYECPFENLLKELHVTVTANTVILSEMKEDIIEVRDHARLMNGAVSELKESQFKIDGAVTLAKWGSPFMVALIGLVYTIREVLI